MYLFEQQLVRVNSGKKNSSAARTKVNRDVKRAGHQLY
jgi:hypothetical protein